MCGRFALNVTHEDLSRIFEVEEVDSPPPRFNIAPTQDVAAVRREAKDPKNHLVILRWGLIPPWAKDASIGNRMINARAETIAEKPSFKKPLDARRCLVLASGFYEWDRASSPKQPFWIRVAGGAPFAMAGIWDRWRSPEGESVESCAIVTTEANAQVAPIHDRMPVILPKESWDRWLGPAKGSEVVELLRPFTDSPMELRPISRAVNNPKNEGARLLDPPEPPGSAER